MYSNKKTIALFLSLLLLLMQVASAIPALAEETTTPVIDDIPEEPYSVVLIISAGLSITGSTATCSVILEPQNNEYCSLTIRLKRLDNHEWKTVHTWTRSGTRISFYETLSVSEGVYKLTASGYAGDEAVSITSNMAVRYP